MGLADKFYRLSNLLDEDGRYVNLVSYARSRSMQEPWPMACRTCAYG